MPIMPIDPLTRREKALFLVFGAALFAAAASVVVGHLLGWF